MKKSSLIPAIAFASVGLASSALADNVLVNGDFNDNSAAFTAVNGYTGAAGDPSSITGWDTIPGVTGGYGLNGTPDTGSPFAPIVGTTSYHSDGTTSPVGTFLFLQESPNGIEQALTLAPNTTYTLTLDTAVRQGEDVTFGLPGSQFATGVTNPLTGQPIDQPGTPGGIGQQALGNVQAGVIINDGSTDVLDDMDILPMDSFTFTSNTLTFTTSANAKAGGYIQLLNTTPQTGVDLSVDFANLDLEQGATVPEPATWSLLWLGVLGAVALIRRRTQAV